MRIGIGLPMTVAGATGHEIVAWGRRAEGRGFSFLATTDHVVYPGLDPLTPLAAVAAVTNSIELLTSVVVVPLRDPVLLAKRAASIDVLSAGRLTLGVSVGWRPDDFTATGSDVRGRGARFDGALEQMTSLWSGAPPTGSAAACPPLPRGRLPVLIGGSPELSGPRVARWGDGWIGGLIPAREVAPAIDEIRRSWDDARRDGHPRIALCRNVALGSDALEAVPSHIDRYYDEADGSLRRMFVDGVLRDPEALAAEIAACGAAGVDDLLLLPFVASLDELDRIADAALP